MLNSGGTVSRRWSRNSAIYTHGEVIARDGRHPAEVRDRAIRIRFAEEYSELTTRRDALEELGDARTEDKTAN